MSMYGKHFASMYSGSMFGKPAIVFAVWGYIISTMRPSRKDGRCYVELNPTLLSATFATTPDEVLDAIRLLASPDEASRTKVEDGRRIVPLDDLMHVGPMQFLVVNGSKYRAIRDEEERRLYLREAKRQQRLSTMSTKSTAVNRRQPPSTQVEEDVEVEGETTTDSPTSSATPGTLPSKQVAEVFAYWVEVMGKPKARLTGDRERRVKARLREGYSVADLKAAVDGCKASAWHQGSNAEGKVFEDLELICRDGKHVEAFMGGAATRSPGNSVDPWDRYDAEEKARKAAAQ